MDEPEFIELCRVARRLAPQQRDQLSDWLMEDKLSEMGEELDNALRMFDYAALDFETGPFGSSQASD
jgi:hypothetical protein